MFVNLIAFSIFLAGLIGMGVVLFRKVPVLAEIPEDTIYPFSWPDFFSKTRKGTLSALQSFFKKISELTLVKNLIFRIKTSARAKNLLERVKESAIVRKMTPSKRFSLETFLQKVLSRVRVLVLKLDNKTSNWLQTLRERAKKRNSLEKDNYWKKLKKLTKK